MLGDKIIRLEEEISALKNELQSKAEQLKQLKDQMCNNAYSNVLSSEEIVRYSRQMIMPQVSVAGQIVLKRSKVLIVGAGGLGCPASLYLAASGVGEIHIMDYDSVELSNLHRQVLHYEPDIGSPKVQSICNKLKKINSSVVVVPLQLHANSSISEEMVKHKYNVVLDCTDNAPSRYLLNDVCVLNNTPLVSGSALQMEGQLTVYNYNNGPCYRCLFPRPPPVSTVTNCGDSGVLGPVAGVIGILQAMESIKILTSMGGVLAGRLLLFDGSTTTFRQIKLRQKVSNCHVCGDNPTITSPVDYELFCGSKAHDKVTDIDILDAEEHIDVEQLTHILNEDNIILDVRPELEYAMCKLPNTFNLPYSKIISDEGLDEIRSILNNTTKLTKHVYLLCRRGNDSQRSVDYLKGQFPKASVKFINIKGGLHAYAKLIDQSFPAY